MHFSTDGCWARVGRDDGTIMLGSPMPVDQGTRIWGPIDACGSSGAPGLKLSRGCCLSNEGHCDVKESGRVKTCLNCDLNQAWGTDDGLVVEGCGWNALDGGLRAVAGVAVLNPVAAWARLFLLPKAVLRPPPRGGAARRDQAA